MQPGDYFTWSRNVSVALVDGRIPAEEMRQRTLEIVYVDRDRNFDFIEWQLDNRDGKLTRPEYIGLGMIVRLRLGYVDGSFPWKAFIINRIQGGVGVYGQSKMPPVGDNESVVTYYGRNRNAPGGRQSRPWRRTARPPGKRPPKVYPATNDVTMNELLLDQGQGPRTVKAATTSEAVTELARRNGFQGDFALIQPTLTPIPTGIVTIPGNVSDGEFILALAEREDFIFKVDNNGLHWHSSTWKGAKFKVVDRLIYGGGTPDILELNIDADFRLPVTRTSSTKGYSYRRRVAITQEAEWDKTKGEANIGLAMTDLFEDEARYRALTRHDVNIIIGDDLTKAQEISVKRFINRHLRAFLLNVKTVGNPRLLAARLVDIGGTGSPFADGRWYISEARHNMGESTYETELKLKQPPKREDRGRIEVGITQEPEWDKKEGKLNLGSSMVHYDKSFTHVPKKTKDLR